MLTAARNTDDPYARLALFSSAWAVLAQVGHDGETWDYVLVEVETSHAPETIMPWLPPLTSTLKTVDNCAELEGTAWNSATGPATGSRKVSALARDTSARCYRTRNNSRLIENITIKVFRELSTDPDAFFHRVTRAMERLETALHEWNAEGAHDDSLARIRAEVLKSLRDDSGRRPVPNQLRGLPRLARQQRHTVVGPPRWNRVRRSRNYHEVGRGLLAGSRGSLLLAARSAHPTDFRADVRKFNTEGPVVAERHYCIPPLERLDLGVVLDLVRDMRYFVLHAPR